jgi:hypothetical protein
MLLAKCTNTTTTNYSDVVVVVASKEEKSVKMMMTRQEALHLEDAIQAQQHAGSPAQNYILKRPGGESLRWCGHQRRRKVQQ